MGLARSYILTRKKWYRPVHIFIYQAGFSSVLHGNSTPPRRGLKPFEPIKHPDIPLKLSQTIIIRSCSEFQWPREKMHSKLEIGFGRYSKVLLDR